MDVRFAQAARRDLPRVLTLLEEFYAVEHLPYREDVARDALQELWSNPSLGRVYLICADGLPAGYIVLTFGFSLEFRGRDALVDELFVRASFRGQGLGAAALQWVEHVCRSEGVHALHLEVDHANERARRLYHREGYRDHARYLLTKRLTD